MGKTGGPEKNVVVIEVIRVGEYYSYLIQSADHTIRFSVGAETFNQLRRAEDQAAAHNLENEEPIPQVRFEVM